LTSKRKERVEKHFDILNKPEHNLT